MKISPKNYSMLVAILVAIETILVFTNASPWIKIPVFFFYLLATGAATGKLFDQTTKPASRIFYGIFLVLCSWTILQTAIYYVWQFQTEILAAFIVLTGTVSVFIEKKQTKQLTFSLKRPKTHDILFSCLFAAEFIAAIAILFRHATENAIRSPWEMVPATFFLLLGLLVFTLFAWQRKSEHQLQTVFAGGLLLLCLLVATIIYKIGYGFDPFIHEAAMKEILAHGFVAPKSPFYIGAYMFILSIAQMTGLSLHMINIMAGPILGAFALTTTAISLGTPAPIIAILLSILAPLSHFISTTPQGIANACALLSVATALQTKKDRKFWIVSLLAALAALSVHPLAGIPALLITSSILLSKQKPHWLITLSLLTCFIALSIFPTAAFFAQKTIHATFTLHDALERFATLITTYFSAPTIQSFNSFRTLIYAARTIFPLIFLFTILFHLRRKEERKTHVILCIAATALALGGCFFGTFVYFQDVIAYEATIFPLRFMTLATLFLFPLFLKEASTFFSTIFKKPHNSLFAPLLLISICVSTTYLTYPRIDPEEKSGGRSVSAATIDAVQYLHNQNMQSAVILGNQTVAAAWISKYGFTKYIGNEFFISEPAASLQLYTYYTDAVEHGPTSELMKKVMEDYKVNTVYFVLHNYWKDFLPLSQAATKNAAKTTSIRNNEILIFTYTK